MRRFSAVLLCAVLLCIAFGLAPQHAAAQAPEPVQAPDPFPAQFPDEPKHLGRIRALYTALDTQHRALNELLTLLRGDLHILTIATKDLSLVTFGIFQRALAICLMTPIELAQQGDIVGATVATAKIKGCMESLPAHLVDEIATLSEADQQTLRGVLKSADTLRINLERTAPLAQTLTDQSAKALIEYAELAATITAEHEFSKLDLLASDQDKALAESAFSVQSQALAVVEAKLKRIAEDLLKVPGEALEVSKAALALSASPAP